MDTYQDDAPYPPVPCSRILQTLDCDRRFDAPYGTKSPFAFAFRDLEFRQPGNRSFKFYMALRRCKDIHEYRQQVIELYQDEDIAIEIKGEMGKLPIQIIPVPKEAHQKLGEIAHKNHFEKLPPLEIPLVFLGTLPLPRMLANPPTGRYRKDYLTDTLTNKIIDFGVLVPETQMQLGIKFLEIEISKYLAPVEAILNYAGELSKRLVRVCSKPIGISLRGTMGDNPAVQEEAFRVPAFCPNFWENPEEQYWPTADIDMNLFCGQDDFEEVYKSLCDPGIYPDVNVNVTGLRILGEKETRSFTTPFSQKHVDIYIMTEEWVFRSVERHLHLGLEHPWAYYYASSYPLLFGAWKDFLDSLYKNI